MGYLLNSNLQVCVFMRYKKQRGQKRKLKTLLKNVSEICPFQNTDCPYEHFHVPGSPFISSPKTSGRAKTAFCKAWLEKTAEIMEHKPGIFSFCKVVAVIDELDLWKSQIIVFYDQGYYDSFWDRTSIAQSWVPVVKQGLSFVQSRHIDSTLKEKAYYETISDSDFTRKTRLWFYGDVL